MITMRVLIFQSEPFLLSTARSSEDGKSFARRKAVTIGLYKARTKPAFNTDLVKLNGKRIVGINEITASLG